MSQQPLDDNYKPIDANLYDASGNQYVSPMAGTVTTDSGGEKYAPHVVSVGDGTTPTQKLAIDSSGNASVSVAEINGVAPSMGNGVSGTGVQRVTIASDSTGQVALATGTAVIGTVEIGDGTTPTQKLAIDASGNASVNVAEINGVAPSMGNGASGTGVQRVTIANDSTGQVALAAGTAVVGTIEIGDGTTPTQKLAVSAAGEASVDLKKINGAAVPLGHGTAATAIRVELPTDGTGVVGLNAGSNLVGGVEIYDGSGVNKLAVSAAGEASVDLKKIGGVAPAVGHGTAATALRVELPTDGTGTVGLNAGSNLVGGVEIYDGAGVNKLAVSAAGEASVDVAKIGGAAVPLGHGLAATALRVELPTDGTGVVGLNTGSNVIGTVEIGDGTTPTQKLAIDASGNASVNVAEVNGVAPSMGNGASGTGVQRVTIANDSTGQVALAAGTAVVGTIEIGDGTTPTQKLAVSAAGEAAVDIKKMNGAAVPLGHGTAATALRVELPTDGTGTVGLNAGSNLVGGVEIYDGAGVNKLAVSAAGEASVDVAKISGAAVPLGHGLAATAIRVELPTDGTGVVGLNAGSNLIGSAKIVDTGGTNEAGVDALHNIYVTDGGTTATAVAAGTAADTVIKASAGRLCRILVTTAGTNAMMIYDNATAGSGKIIGGVAANAVAGTWVDAQMPAANGITVDGDANNPAVTISFS